MKNSYGTSSIFLKLTFAFILLTFINCSKSDPAPEPGEFTKNANDLEESVVKFGFDQLTSLYNSEDGNVIISPLSIASALYMTSNGANNKTLDQMVNTLYVHKFQNELNDQYRLLQDKLINTEGQAHLSMDNQVFFDDARINLSPDYINTINTFYESKAESLDFSRSSAVDEINNWVSESTNERIPKVLEEISNQEAMFLINALYFIGDWENGFPETVTSDRKFTLSNGDEIQVPTMWNDAGYTFVKTDVYSAVELPFKDGKYSMTFVLPEGQNLAEFLESYTADEYANWIGGLSEEMDSNRLMLTLPKMELKEKYSLKESLKGLGMKDAFSKGDADFSNFGEAGGNIFLTRVLHDVFIKIDEKGVEGAAATTVGVGVTSLPPQIDLNRPFLFVLNHKETNVPVFMGAVRNPIEE